MNQSVTASEPRLIAIKNRLEKLNMEAGELSHLIKSHVNSIHAINNNAAGMLMESPKPIEAVCVLDDIEVKLNIYAQTVVRLQETLSHLREIV